MILQKIKEAMILRKVKSIELATELGITRSSMSLFINGKTNLSQSNIEKALRYLDIDLVIN